MKKSAAKSAKSAKSGKARKSSQPSKAAKAKRAAATRAVTHREWLIGISRDKVAKDVKEPAVLAVLYEVLTDARLRPIPGHFEEVSILFTTDQTIQALNREYRGKDKATDVLSFAGQEDLTHLITPSLGDVVISIETAGRQAKKFGWSLGAELLRLLIHGTLHLCGYDHEGVSKTEAEKMRRLEKALHQQLRKYETQFLA